jgi:glycerol uptake facilitator-like aquaporin
MVPGVLGALAGIYFCASCAGKLTGGVFNANLGFCNVTFCAIVKNDGSVLKYLPAYLFGPYIGACLAGVYVKYFLFKVVPELPNKKDENDESMLKTPPS